MWRAGSARSEAWRPRPARGSAERPMEFEPWYLSALPVLFAVGWWARGHEANVRAADQGAAPRSLFRGLQLLLSEQPDRAIDAFIEVVKLDPETIELHYALGSLFRR